MVTYLAQMPEPCAVYVFNLNLLDSSLFHFLSKSIFQKFTSFMIFRAEFNFAVISAIAVKICVAVLCEHDVLTLETEPLNDLDHEVLTVICQETISLVDHFVVNFLNSIH